MMIYLANPRGFAGVDRAIDIVDLSLKKYGAQFIFVTRSSIAAMW